MSEEILSGRQRELAAAAAAAARKLRSGTDQARRPAVVGEVFVLEATADFPVEWALLEQRGEDGPFLAVPGDSHPFLGSRDLDVEASTGRLHLRCQAAVWLEPAALAPGLRSGTLEPEDLERARRKIREVTGKDFAPDPFLEEVDLSPEYAEWMRDVIQPARAAAGSPGFAPAIEPAVRPPARPLLWWWAAAAAAFVLVAMGLAGRIMWQSRQIEGLAARSGSSEAALQAERVRREEEQRKAAEALKERDEREGELQGRISALEERLNAPELPRLNLPVAILQPAEVLRGTDLRSYRLPASAPALTVVLKFRDTEDYPAYRLVVTRNGEAAPVWRTDGLERSTEGIQLALPRRYLPPGRYRLSLSGLRSGKAQPVADYELAITR